MRKRRIEQLRRCLERREAEIRENLRTKEEEYREVSQESHAEAMDEAQVQSDSFTRDVMQVHGDRQLTSIQAALQRIREERYGLCVACGGRIDEGRLNARPEAALCIACERRNEKR